jgi:lipoprotein NlpI
MGNACADLDDLGAAEAHCRAAISLDPGLPEAHASLGHILTRQGRLTEAVAACDVALAPRSDFSQAHWNRAIALLLAGNLRDGFAAQEWRKRHKPFRHDFPALPGLGWRQPGRPHHHLGA